jgi:hypothetical protein
MVRAVLRALDFTLEPRNRDEVVNIIMKQWKLTTGALPVRCSVNSIAAWPAT